MTYQPYLISNYSTGLDRELQPWLLPEDAMTELFDGYVYRGVTNKRDGYKGYANGRKSTYTESRIVHTVTFGFSITSGVIDGANDTFVIQLTLPVIPGSITINGSNPVQVVTDDGAGNLVGAGTGTVNYVTGVINLVFTAPPAFASTITVTYGNFAVGNGTNGPYSNTITNVPISRGSITLTAGVQTLTDNGNGYSLLTPINISNVGLTNPALITTSVNHGYTTGDQVVLSSILGTTELNSVNAYTITVTGLTTFTLDGIDATGYTPYASGGTAQKVTATYNYTTGLIIANFVNVVAIGVPITISYSYHPGLPVMGIMRFYPKTSPVEMLVADTRYVNRYDRTTDRLVDITTTVYSGNSQDFWSWTNYDSATSVPRLLFCNGASGDEIQQWDGTTVTRYNFTSATIIKMNARQIFEFQDRLILFQTYETIAGPTTTFYPKRIRISGFGANTDSFDSTSPGAGFIDIPDNTNFYGAAFNRDDLMFFTESSAWILKYTGNDINPFVLKRLDGSRGSKAAFSVISYLNRTMAASPRGLIIADGYNLSRMDNNLPDFSFNSINNEFFKSCFSGFIDEDRDVYMLYPSEGEVRPALVPASSSDRILVSNFEEDNFAIYRIPLSCMGNFEESNTILWSDLTPENGFPTWDALAAVFSSWNAFPYSEAVPVAIGGGHKGEIWSLNVNESEDNPQRIRNITIVTGVDNDGLQVTTDWNNYEVGDYIFFTGVQGMTEVNDLQGYIKSIDVDFNTFTVIMPVKTDTFSAWTSGGIASRVIPFVATSKKLNPFINQDRKVKCGWIYFYVSTTDTWLNETAFLDIDVFMNDYGDNTTPSFSYRLDLSTGADTQSKRWVKIWINQVGQFLQFRMRNTQAGTRIQVHAMMPGFNTAGRIL